MLDDLFYRLKALVGKKKLEAELDEELRLHLEHEAAKYEREGISARTKLGARRTSRWEALSWFVRLAVRREVSDGQRISFRIAAMRFEASYGARCFLL